MKKNRNISYWILVSKNYKETSFRTILLQCIDNKLPGAEYLYKLNIKGASKFLNGLKSLIENDWNEYEWGSDEFYVESNKNLSICRDLINNENLFTVSTSKLVNYLESYYNYLCLFEEGEKLKKIITEAFQQIKSKNDSINNDFYFVEINEIHIRIAMDKEDFEIDNNHFYNQLNTFPQFLASSEIG